MSDKNLKVGVCVVLRDADNNILLGKRKRVLGEGTWGLPGGHQKVGESIFECAKREVALEIGIELTAMSLIDVTEVVDTGLDYQLVELGYESKEWEGIFDLHEHKHYSEWRFFDPHRLPDEIFEPHRPIIEKVVPQVETLYTRIQPGFKITVAAFVENVKGELLLGLRKDEYDKGCWAVPGGHLDVGETFGECVLRELEEETGIVGKTAFQFGYVEQPVTLSDKHYIHFGYIVRDIDTEDAIVGEPEDIERFEWFALDKIPHNLAPTQKELILKYLKVKKIALSKN
jgi:8-oxo-dGTP diphosphatase